MIQIRAPKVRLLTALAVIGICLWLMWRGFDMFLYSMGELKPEAALPWIDTPGLASLAREYALTPIDDSSDDKTIQERRGELEELLAIRPLSSISWLRLAKVRVDAGEDPARAIDALKLSMVTGPNEGYMLTQRGLFGIWQWEALPPEIRKHAIADLVARQVPDAGLAWLRTTLANKTDQVRQEIRSALQAQGLSRSNFERIGL
jgi:hypothetical protein